MNKSKEFLDTVADDTPRESWSLKHDPSNNLIVLRSLEYPGYVHFQMVDNPTYGSAYMGTGYKNEDLVHML
jgi:radial spoke head protein 9